MPAPLTRLVLPSGRRGQVLALAIAFLALSLLWLAVGDPLVQWYEARTDRLAQRIQVLAHMEQVAARLPGLEARAVSAAEAAVPTLRTLDGATDALAAAALQNRLQEMATAAGATLTSVEIMETGAVGDYRRISLKLSFSAPWRVLVGFLQAIEQSPLPMLLDGVQIRGAASPTTEAKLLDASLTVAAFRLTAQGSAAAAPQPEKAP